MDETKAMMITWAGAGSIADDCWLRLLVLDRDHWDPTVFLLQNHRNSIFAQFTRVAIDDSVHFLCSQLRKFVVVDEFNVWDMLIWGNNNDNYEFPHWFIVVAWDE